MQLQARVWPVIYNMHNRNNRVNGQQLLPEDIEDAKEDIISQAQLEAFPEEYEALLRGRKLQQALSLAGGVMQCGGRLTFAKCLPYDIWFPVILPRDQWVTRLIVKNYHELSNHNAGTKFVLLVEDSGLS